MIDLNATTEIAGMSKEVYQLLDTTIKIGLGALISGIVTYITTKMNHKHEIDKLEKNNESETYKYKLQMKIKILENTQEQIDEFSMICEEFLDILLTCKNRNILSRLELEEKDTSLFQKFTSSKRQVSTELSKLRKACSKLILLGFDNSAIKIKKMSDIVLIEYNRLNTKSAVFMNDEDYRLYRDNFAKTQMEYHIAIREDFEKLQ